MGSFSPAPPRPSFDYAYFMVFVRVRQTNFGLGDYNKTWSTVYINANKHDDISENYSFMCSIIQVLQYHA